MTRHILFLAAASGVLIGETGFADHTTPNRLEVSSGTVSFEVATNVPGIRVKGTAKTLTADVQVESGAEGLMLRQIDARVPVRGLLTGMKVRDEHMQKYIFTTPDGQMPDIAFSSDGGLCKLAAGQLTCQISGVLKIRGASHPLALSVLAKEENGAAKAFRATVDTTIKLTDFSIEAPSQFGVKPSNDVKIHLEFTAKEKAGALAAVGAGK